MVSLIDSSGWFEYFTNGHLAEKYSYYLEDLSKVITPVIVLYEVYKKIKKERSEEEALILMGQIGKTKIIALDDSLVLFAADVSLKYKLPMADAIVYATAIENNAKVITSDKHFRNLPNAVLLR